MAIWKMENRQIFLLFEEIECFNDIWYGGVRKVPPFGQATDMKGGERMVIVRENPPLPCKRFEL